MNSIRLALAVLAGIGLFAGCGEEIRDPELMTAQDFSGAESVAGLAYTATERDLMREDLAEQRAAYRALRKTPLDNAVRPAVRFDPLMFTPERPLAVFRDLPADASPRWETAGPVSRPADLNNLAFTDVGRLGALLRQGQVTCLELTELFLRRLETHGPRLECVVTLMPARARERARELDRMLARGEDLGPLHGIPYGAKDLLAVPGAPTTWGAAPYRDQVRPETATVVSKLEDAGAVLVAKLTLGALAWGDVWFGGTTRNPWNTAEGSSGSSAGSAAAVSAGLVPFAIGTETWGSIVSPSTRCGVTGLRPTFGRVSRAGAMALSWTMDKIGPIARSTVDCAMVFDAIRGPDGIDPTVVDLPFPYTPVTTLAGLKIGYLDAQFAEDYPGRDLDRQALQVLRDQGAELVPVELPLAELNLDPFDLSFILSAEAAAAFQELTLSGRDDQLVRQVRAAWPNVFRAAHLIPAVEYVQANRHRTRLMELMASVFATVDVYVTPSLSGPSLLVTNLTGHPQVVLPAGFRDERSPHSISFVGRLYDEATLLRVAGAYERATVWHMKSPPGF